MASASFATSSTTGADGAKPAPMRCITIIGMAGAGKTTVGAALAAHIGWAHLDTDDLIESFYGVPLQKVADALSKDGFLNLEAGVIQGVWAAHAVLSTGGSVVYRHEAMEYLKSLGPIIHLQVPLATILERIARNPDRGLAIAPGQTIEDLFLERERLYARYADFVLSAEKLRPDACARAIAEWLNARSFLTR